MPPWHAADDDPGMAPPSKRALDRPPPAPRSDPPPLAEFDRRKARKIAAGREDIAARIDLHGMRQSEAHAALRGFLRRCHAEDKRTVLVITGKGVPAKTASEAKLLADLIDGRERGILRRNVPLWLEEPDMRAIVVSHRPAASRHGGDGALYIHLRAKTRKGG